MALLEEQREAMIRERAIERNKREQERLKAGGAAEGAKGNRGRQCIYIYIYTYQNVCIEICMYIYVYVCVCVCVCVVPV